MTVDVRTLFSTATFADLYKTGLEVLRVAGVLVTSWRTGDPTLALFKFLCEELATRDATAELFVKSAFLSTSTGDWKTLLAQEVFGVERDAATYAAPTVLVANAGGYYPLEPGDVTFKSTLSGQTFHNTNAVTLNPSGTGTFELECDVAGSDGTVGVDEIDELVTPLLGVTITSSTAALGADEQGDDSLDTECRDSLGALSPNGPADAYRSVACNPLLTGVTDVTRAATEGDTVDGTVAVYIASATGGVGAGSVAAVQSAVDVWATPQCMTPTAVSASAVLVPVIATVSGTDIPADYAARALAGYQTLIRAGRISTTARPASVTRTAISAAIHDALVAGGASDVTVAISVPAADVVLTVGQVATESTFSVTEA